MISVVMLQVSISPPIDGHTMQVMLLGRRELLPLSASGRSAVVVTAA